MSGQNEVPESLRVAADALLEAAYRYWRELGAVAGSRARGEVFWLEDTAGRVVIFTYRQHLMENIRQRGLELHFTELPPKEDDQ